VAVDGQPVTDLDTFLEAVQTKGDRDAVRLETVDLDGKPDVITLKLDLEYWPTYELRRNGGAWERVSHRSGEDGGEGGGDPAHVVQRLPANATEAQLGAVPGTFSDTLRGTLSGALSGVARGQR
jgi:hypothetical protein